MKPKFDFIKELRTGCLVLGLPEVDDLAAERLLKYFTELKRWSRKVNLIARGTSDSEILEKHFLDSLTLLPVLTGENVHLLDIGTGAGFPGLVCKAAMPDLELTLVEPRQRRVSFLRHVLRTLAIADVSVLECRAEDEGKLSSETEFTHITSRAVNEIKLFLSMCERFAEANTKVICMKGPKWKEEHDLYLASDSRQLFFFDMAKEYLLPNSKSLRYVMVFKSNIEKIKK